MKQTINVYQEEQQYIGCVLLLRENSSDFFSLIEPSSLWLPLLVIVTKKGRSWYFELILILSFMSIGMWAKRSPQLC